MKTELESYLKKKFPKLYTDVGEQEPFTLYAFECEDGWFRIILWLSRYLQSYIDQQNKYAIKYPDQYKPVEQIKVVQVKEKFGTLRYYTRGGNEHTNTVITFVEFISGYICETTGKTDEVGYNKTGWIKVHHSGLAKSKDFHYIDDKELREIINKQLEFKFDSETKQ